MASVEKISHKSEPTKEFLQKDETHEITAKLDGTKDNLNTILDTIEDQQSSGLSLEALNIDGRAPLNELSLKICKLITDSIDDYTNLKKIIHKEGNKHRQDEANEYYKRVKDYYKKVCESLNEEVEKYNELKFYRNITDSNGNVTKSYGSYPKCEFTEDDTFSTCNKATGHIEAYDGDLNEANHNIIKANIDSGNKSVEEWFKKLEEAKELKKECDGLDTYSVSSVTEKDLKGFKGYKPQEGYKHTTEIKNGKTIDTYEDLEGKGEKIVVTSDENGNRTNKEVYNSNGILIQDIKYQNGKPSSKTEYDVKEEQVDGVTYFKSTPSQYQYNSNQENPWEIINKDNKIAYFRINDNSPKQPLDFSLEKPSDNWIKGKRPVTVTSYEELNEAIKNKNDINIPSNIELGYDGKNNYKISDEKLYYDFDEGKYYYMENDKEIKLSPDTLSNGNNNGNFGTGENDSYIKEVGGDK